MERATLPSSLSAHPAAPADQVMADAAQARSALYQGPRLFRWPRATARHAHRATIIIIINVIS